MTELAGENYTIEHRPDEAAVRFKGVLRLSSMADYQPVLDLLDEALARQNNDLTIDVRALDMLNSSGIAMLSRFVIACRNGATKLRMVGSSSNAWQAKSLRNLQRLMPDMHLEFV